jgi:hypothetical protein
MIKIKKKIEILIDNKFNYIIMKLLSRVFLLKKIFLFINHINYKNKFSQNSFFRDQVFQLSNESSINEIVNDLNNDGFSAKLKLNKEYLIKILDYVDKNPCYAYGDQRHGFFLSERKECENKINKEILLAKYFNFQNQEPFIDIVNSPLLQKIADAYLGRNAKNIATQMWWTFPANVDLKTKSKAAHLYHRDVDAWAFVKFFFYLNDVFEDGGPHVYVKQSHKPSFFNQMFLEKFMINRHSDDFVIRRFGHNAICPIYGSAGTGFAADTFGFHRGISPIKKSRLLICCVYATKDYGIQEFSKKPELLSHFKY